MLEFNVSVFPSHTGLLLLAVGVFCNGFTTTDVVDAGPVHPDAVAVTVYAPLPLVVMLAIVGF